MQKILLAGLIALTPMIALADTSTGSMTPPPRPPMGSSAQDDENNIHQLGMVISELNAVDREALLKIIRDYVISKGVDLSKLATKDKEIKAVKQEARTAIQGVREEKKQIIQTKRLEMRGKIRDIRQQSGSGTTR